MLPKQEINDITLKINNRLLGIEQYEFICLRLIDTIRQLEEENSKLKAEKLKEIESEIKRIKNDKRF